MDATPSNRLAYELAIFERMGSKHPKKPGFLLPLNFLGRSSEIVLIFAAECYSELPIKNEKQEDKEAAFLC